AKIDSFNISISPEHLGDADAQAAFDVNQFAARDTSIINNQINRVCGLAAKVHDLVDAQANQFVHAKTPSGEFHSYGQHHSVDLIGFTQFFNVLNFFLHRCPSCEQIWLLKFQRTDPQS